MATEVVDGELVARDLPEFLRVLEDMKEKVPHVRCHVEQLSSLVTSPETNTENGISLLEVKVHLLLSSLINLVQLILMKTEGHSINAAPPVLRLVEIRTVLEKLRPLDQKLRYQIDKLIRMAKTGLTGTTVGNDPLRFRANPANLVAKLDEEEEAQLSGESERESDDDEGEKSTKLYVPPKVVAMPYDGEDGEGVKRRKTKIQSSIVHELRNEYLDLPEEVNDVGSGMRNRQAMLEERERETFEESNFVRLPKRRKGQSSQQRGGAREVLDELELGEFPSSSVQKKRRVGSHGHRRRIVRGSKAKKRRSKRKC